MAKQYLWKYRRIDRSTDFVVSPQYLGDEGYFVGSDDMQNVLYHLSGWNTPNEFKVVYLEMLGEIDGQ